jgi:hypothetical protein
MERITHQSPRKQGYGSTSSLRNDSLKHTRKHERKEGGIEPRNKAARFWWTVQPGGADCPQSPRGQSGQVPRTVRKDHADHPARSHGLSVKANRTTRTDPRKMDRPRRPGGPSARVPDRPLLKLGPSANRLQQKPKTKPDQTETKKNTKNTTMNWAEQAPRGPSAEKGRTVRQVKQSRKLPSSRSQPHQLITGNPKRFKFLRQDLGKMLGTPM